MCKTGTARHIVRANLFVLITFLFDNFYMRWVHLLSNFQSYLEAYLELCEEHEKMGYRLTGIYHNTLVMIRLGQSLLTHHTLL